MVGRKNTSLGVHNAADLRAALPDCAASACGASVHVDAHLHELLEVAAAALLHDDVHVVGVLVHALKADRVAVLLEPAHDHTTLCQTMQRSLGHPQSLPSRAGTRDGRRSWRWYLHVGLL